MDAIFLPLAKILSTLRRYFWVMKTHRSETVILVLVYYVIAIVLMAGVSFLFTEKFIISLATLYALGASVNTIDVILGKDTDSKESLRIKNMFLGDISWFALKLNVLMLALFIIINITILSNPYFGLICLFGHILVYLCAGKPFCLKGKPLGCILSNVLGWDVMTVLSAYFLFGGSPLVALLLIIVFLPLVSSLILACELVDIEPDRAVGHNTTAVYLGKKRAAHVILGLMGAYYLLIIFIGIFVSKFFLITFITSLFVIKELIKITKNQEPEFVLVSLTKTGFWVVIGGLAYIFLQLLLQFLPF